MDIVRTSKKEYLLSTRKMKTMYVPRPEDLAVFVLDDKPRGVSNAAWWIWYDSLPSQEKRFIEQGQDGADVQWRVQRALQLYPPNIDYRART